MDPLSITVSVASLLGVCFKVASGLKAFRDDIRTVDPRVKGLIGEVESFTQTLKAMESTLQDSQVKDSCELTGHIGDHWRSISGCIVSGMQTLENLQSVLERVNESTRMFDSARKQLRFKEAAEEISVYQNQIRSYRDIIQLSLQTAVFWNQVCIKDATTNTLPKLDELSLMIRHLSSDLNVRLATLEGMIDSPSRNSQIKGLRSLRTCLRTSADVVSSASTTLGVDDATSVAYLSDFRDIFPPRKQSVMRQWITGIAQSRPTGSVHEDLGLVDDSDSEAEIEAEMLQMQLQKGKELLQAGNTATAEKFLASGMSKLKHHKSRYLDTERKLIMLDDLLKTYDRQHKWEDVKRIRLERMSILSEDTSSSPNGYLEETLKLAQLLLDNEATSEAREYARKCIRSYRKLGPEGTEGLKQALLFMVMACHMDGDVADEDVYGTMLSKILEKEDAEGGLVLSARESAVPKENDTGRKTSNHARTKKKGSTTRVRSNLTSGKARNTKISQPASGRSNTNSAGSRNKHHAVRSDQNRRTEALPRSSPSSIGHDQVRDLFRLAPFVDSVDDSESDSAAKKTRNHSRVIYDTSEPSSPILRADSPDSQGREHWFETSLGTPDASNVSNLAQSSSRSSSPFKPGGDTSFTAIEAPNFIPPVLVRNWSWEKDDGTVGDKLPHSINRSHDPHTECSQAAGADVHHQSGFLVPPSATARPTSSTSISKIVPESIRQSTDGILGISFNTTIAQDSDILYASRSGQPVPGGPSPSRTKNQHRYSKSDSQLPGLERSLSPLSDLEKNPLKVTFPELHDDTASTSTGLSVKPIGYILQNLFQTTTPLRADRRSEDDDRRENIPSNPRVTCLVVGPSCVGKTTLIYRYLHMTDEPQINNGLMVHYTNVRGPNIDGTVDVVIWDTPGEISNVRKTEAVQNVDCVILCTTVDSPDDTADLESSWAPEIRRIHPGCPIILAALRVDLRREEETLRMLSEVDDQPLSSAEGKRIMDRVGAVSYFDCSSKTRQGVDDLFHEAAVQGLRAKMEVRRPRNFWKFSRRSLRGSRRSVQ